MLNKQRYKLIIKLANTNLKKKNNNSIDNVNNKNNINKSNNATTRPKEDVNNLAIYITINKAGLYIDNPNY